jgi:hypothetical protein
MVTGNSVARRFNHSRDALRRTVVDAALVYADLAEVDKIKHCQESATPVGCTKGDDEDGRLKSGSLVEER